MLYIFFFYQLQTKPYNEAYFSRPDHKFAITL